MCRTIVYSIANGACLFPPSDTLLHHCCNILPLLLPPKHTILNLTAFDIGAT